MDIEKEVRTLMQQNQRVVGGNFFTVPSPERYPFQWLWDSCFHSIIYTALHEHQSAKSELLSVLRKQHSNGLLPHITFWHPPDTPLPNWGRESRGHDLNHVFGVTGTSSLTQPPLVARAVFELYKKTNDEELLKEALPKLVSYFNYLHKNRTLQRSALLYIINPDESGEDNARRFDIPLSLTAESTDDEHLTKRIELMENLAACAFETKTCMKEHFAVIDVSFNSIYVDGLSAMNELLLAAGKKKEAVTYKKREEKVVNEMRKKLTDDGVRYFAYDIRKKLSLKTIDWNIFMPLYAGLLTKEEATTLVSETLTSELFWSSFGVRTLQKNNLAYDPENGFWRGPVWMVPHYFIYKGLCRYGFTEEAAKIKKITGELITKSGFREHYNGETGKGGGAHHFTWAGLYLAMD